MSHDNDDCSGTVHIPTVSKANGISEEAVLAWLGRGTLPTLNRCLDIFGHSDMSGGKLTTVPSEAVAFLRDGFGFPNFMADLLINHCRSAAISAVTNGGKELIDSAYKHGAEAGRAEMEDILNAVRQDARAEILAARGI